MTDAPLMIEFVRIFMVDGITADARLVVPWPIFLQNLLQMGGVATDSVFINRSAIVRCQRLMAPDVPETMDGLLHVSPAGSA